VEGVGFGKHGGVAVTTEAPAGTDATRTPSTLAVGVVVWLASEMMFFAGLFAAYFTLRSVNDVWPPEGVELATGRTALATVALLASSATMHGAVAGARRDDRGAAIRWFGVTILLGALFLANLVTEYVEADFRWHDHAYGSIFYLLTGFHGAHLLGGLVFMVAIAAAIAGKTSRAPAEQLVEVCGYYWHFVDVVWVAMFVTVYLIK
jgi:cytochrome c oxidase subunit III